MASRPMTRPSCVKDVSWKGREGEEGREDVGRREASRDVRLGVLRRAAGCRSESMGGSTNVQAR